MGSPTPAFDLWLPPRPPIFQNMPFAALISKYYTNIKTPFHPTFPIIRPNSSSSTADSILSGFIS